MIVMAEGHFVRHRADKFVGVHAGYTRLAHLLERPGDQRAVRVKLPDGSIKVASGATAWSGWGRRSSACTRPKPGWR